MGNDYSVYRVRKALLEATDELSPEIAIPFGPLAELKTKLLQNPRFQSDPHAAADQRYFAEWRAQKHMPPPCPSEGLYFIDGDCGLRIRLVDDPVEYISIDHGRLEEVDRLTENLTDLRPLGVLWANAHVWAPADKTSLFESWSCSRHRRS